MGSEESELDVEWEEGSECEWDWSIELEAAVEGAGMLGLIPAKLRTPGEMGSREPLAPARPEPASVTWSMLLDAVRVAGGLSDVDDEDRKDRWSFALLYGSTPTQVVV